jgi:hypothetical protein
METLTQYLAKHPALASATKNLAYKKRLRRVVIEAIKDLEGSTSKRDLTKKVLARITSNATKMSLLFSEYERARFSKAGLIYNFLEEPVALAVEKYTGVRQKSNLECEILWARASKTKMKNVCGNTDIHLTGSSDRFRVYITNGNVEMAQMENVQPSFLLDNETADRRRFSTPRQVTALKMDDEKALLLFHDFGNGHQRRFLVPLSRLSNFKFEPINKAYLQEGTHLTRKDFTGDEFTVNSYGEPIEEKTGVEPQAYVLDVCYRGRMGNFGPIYVSNKSK